MASRRKRTARRGRKPPRRWLALVIGLAAGLGALWLMLSGGADGPPLGDIDPVSRARLERVLERADREAPRP